MCNDTFTGFADLEDLGQLQADTAKPKEQKRWPCPKCAGTGKYRGPRVYQEATECFACGGRGYFLTSPEHRAKLRKTREANAQKRVIELGKKIGAFKRQYEAEYKWMLKNQDWNSFAESLVEQLNRKGELSDRQVEVLQGMMAKTEASRAARAAERAAAVESIGEVARIVDLFSTAFSSGLKRPKLRFSEGLEINRAPDHGKNAGYLYVKVGGEYAGKISPDGRWMPVRSAPQGLGDQLRAIAKDPAGQGKLYGQQTGSCCCCGRELTNQESIELGIGPICMEKWGM